MRHLYLQIYLTFVGIIVLFVILASMAWVLAPDREEDQRVYEGISALLAELLPGTQAPGADLQHALERLGAKFPARLTVRSQDGALLAAVGEPLPAPEPGKIRSGWMHVAGSGPGWAIRLQDDRWLIASHTRRHPRARGFLVALGLLALAIAGGAYPIARRITRRLERLKVYIDELGAGDLAARAEVKGNDEVASLARSFNRAAERIELLVNAQKSMLASASHELRTPLARIRIAIELLAGDTRPELREQVARDIAELDELIEDLLLASRLDALDELEITEELDLLALLAEEAAQIQAEVSGQPTTIQGDPRMLRRLIRNLLENAQRYGKGSTVEASAAPTRGGATLRVCDRGPGVPEEERERIFEPFYRQSGMVERTGDGVGLGLALVRQIARRHGGDAVCLPREGGGTCFEVSLNMKL